MHHIKNFERKVSRPLAICSVVILAQVAVAQSWLCNSTIMTDKVVVNTYSKKTVPFAHCNDSTCVVNADTLLSTVYIPTAMKGNVAMPDKFPFILLLTGGGFTEGDHNMKQWPEAFVKRGFLVATMDYRLGWDVDGDGEIAEDDTDGDTVPAMCVGDRYSYLRAVIRARIDADAAIRYFLGDTVAYRIDTAALFTGGPSAGGSLGLHIGLGDVEEHLALWQSLADTMHMIADPCDMRYDPRPCFAITDSIDSIGFYEGSYRIKGIMNCWGQLLGPALIDPGPDTAHAVPDETGIISFYGGNDHVHPPYIARGCFEGTDSLWDGYGSQRLHELRLQYGYCSQIYEDPDAVHKEVFLDGIDTVPGSIGSAMRRTRSLFIAKRACCFFKSVICGTPCSFDSTFVMDGTEDWAQAYYNEYGTTQGEPIGCKKNGTMKFKAIPPPDNSVTTPPRMMDQVEDYTRTADLVVLPNPSNGAVHLIWDSDSEEAQYVVIDAIGRNVLQGVAMNNGRGFDSSILDSGLYTVVLEDLGVRYTARIVVRH
ncbi:MAG: T9SS type A sorting domain-containing protein [Flavobacteriales bacterium]